MIRSKTRFAVALALSAAALPALADTLKLVSYGLVKHVGGYSASDYQFADWSILDSGAVDQLSGYTPTAALLASDAPATS